MWLWREKKSLLDERVMDELTLEAQSSSSSPFRYLLLVQLTLWPFLIASLARSATACTATSTTPTPDCATCTADQLTLTQGDGTTSTTPTASAIITDGNGCFHIMVTCTAVNGGMTFMQFNVNQGGPINPTGTVVTATLDCVGGQWVYQQGGISRVITEVNCQNT